MTCSIPIFPLRSHSLVCIENHLFIVGIGTILNKELEFIFRSDRSDHTVMLIEMPRFQYIYYSSTLMGVISLIFQICTVQ